MRAGRASACGARGAPIRFERVEGEVALVAGSPLLDDRGGRPAQDEEVDWATIRVYGATDAPVVVEVDWRTRHGC